MTFKPISTVAKSCVALLCLSFMASLAVADIALPPNLQPKPPKPAAKKAAQIKVVFARTDKAVLTVPKKLRGHINAAKAGGEDGASSEGAAPTSAPRGNESLPQFSLPFNTAIAGGFLSLAAILAGLTLMRRRMENTTRLAAGAIAGLAIFAIVAVCVSQSSANAPPPERFEVPVPQVIEYGTFDVEVKYVEKGDVIELQLPIQRAGIGGAFR